MPLLSTMRIPLMIIALMINLQGCSADTSEKQRISSPDGSFQALIIEKRTGATVSTPTEVYVVLPGKSAGKSAVFVADKVEGATVRWIAPRVLEIGYARARIFSFTNFWDADGKPPIEIRLNPQQATSLP